MIIRGRMGMTETLEIIAGLELHKLLLFEKDMMGLCISLE